MAMGRSSFRPPSIACVLPQKSNTSYRKSPGTLPNRHSYRRCNHWRGSYFRRMGRTLPARIISRTAASLSPKSIGWNKEPGRYIYPGRWPFWIKEQSKLVQLAIATKAGEITKFRLKNLCARKQQTGHRIGCAAICKYQRFDPRIPNISVTESQKNYWTHWPGWKARTALPRLHPCRHDDIWIRYQG